MKRTLWFTSLVTLTLLGCSDEDPTRPIPVEGPSFYNASGYWEVTKLTDTDDGSCDSDCSLREAISAAAAGDQISFAPGLTTTAPATINLSAGTLWIDKSLTITGPGADRLMLSGAGSEGVLSVSEGATVEITDLTVANGRNWAGVSNHGILTLRRCVISDNQGQNGGGIVNGYTGVLRIERCTITRNISTYDGSSLAGAGVANYRGTITIVESTISSNTARVGGGVGNYQGTVTITGSTITDNVASFPDAPHLAGGGGIYNDYGTLTVENSTVSGNRAEGSARGDAGGGIHSNQGVMRILLSTITGNHAASAGGGVYTFTGSDNRTAVKGSVIWENTRGLTPTWDDVDRTAFGTGYDSHGYNLIGAAGAYVDFTSQFSQTTDQTNVTDAGLGELADNGGPTWTHALAGGSPALDRGTCADFSGATVGTDQRGVSRPQGSACDIGAVEMEGGPSTNNPPTAHVGGPYSGDEGSAVPLSLSGSDPDGDALTYTWDLGDGTTGSGATPPTSHSYADDGTFIITLGVSDGNGGTDSKATSATIRNVAPTVTSITAPLDPVAIGTDVNLSASFSDPGVNDAPWSYWIDWGDATVASSGSVDTQGTDAVTGTHSYAAAGVYQVKVVVADNTTQSGSLIYQYVVVYDPSAGFATGGGWIESPAGAYKADPTLTGKAEFGFVSRYVKTKTTPVGGTEFQFSAAGMDFHSDVQEWLVVNQGGTNAQFKGVGTINDIGAYAFMIWAEDGTPDTFRIRIWEEIDGVEYDVYDNGFEQAISGGSIKVHTK